MNLIDEQDRPSTGLAQTVAGQLHNCANVFNARTDSAQLLEMRPRNPGDQTSEGCLSTARWAPENHGRYAVFVNRSPEDFAWGQDVGLPRVIVKSLGPHASGKGCNAALEFIASMFEQCHWRFEIGRSAFVPFCTQLRLPRPTQVTPVVHTELNQLAPRRARLFSRQGFRGDRVVGAAVVGSVSTIVQFSYRDPVASIPVRCRRLPGHERALRQCLPGNLLHYTSTVAVVYTGNMQPGVVAPLEMPLNHIDNFVSAHPMQVDFDIDRVDPATWARSPRLF